MSIEPKYLVRLIKACKASGVSELKLGSLEIKFGPGDAAQAPVAATGEAVPTPKELAEAEDLAGDQRMLDSADEELAHMQVENPALFEELLINRELELTSGQDGEIPID